MPIYEYACQQCHQVSEILQKISDPPATTCPQCGAEALTKQVSAAGFRLAGGGWYETDFKQGGQRNLKEGGGSAGDSGGSGGSGSSGGGDGGGSAATTGG
ncbi:MULTISPECIES: FmdB family zinc ribbon protein [unclassified Thioalkalivibrio]|uniref:FmdB family zinc ribbon protein n=1 Tax=unclassified Thioalkalivibrio TaxID=2621013 RepID=UPI000369B820|nr:MULTISPECIES: zinc ribbon domain-containing protein [unclassified Thioalkalivibrio]